MPFGNLGPLRNIKSDDGAQCLRSRKNVLPPPHHHRHNFISKFDSTVALPKVYPSQWIEVSAELCCVIFIMQLYRVTQQVSESDLGWGDFVFGFSAVCLIFLGLMRDNENGQSSWARRVEHLNQS